MLLLFQGSTDSGKYHFCGRRGSGKDPVQTHSNPYRCPSQEQPSSSFFVHQPSEWAGALPTLQMSKLRPRKIPPGPLGCLLWNQKEASSPSLSPKLDWVLLACGPSACPDGWQVQLVGTTVCTGPTKLCGKAEAWGESVRQPSSLLSASPPRSEQRGAVLITGSSQARCVSNLHIGSGDRCALGLAGLCVGSALSLSLGRTRLPALHL